MRKYAPVIKSDWDGYGSYENSFHATMYESANGEWVKLSTFVDTVAHLNAQIERLKKASEKEPEIKVGDKLRITNLGGEWGHCYKVGDIVVVTSIDETNDETINYELEYNVKLEINGFESIRQVINKDDFERVV
jgi:hypothetical protein